MTELPAHVRELIDAAADRYGVSIALARAIAWRESRGKQSAVSRAGAVGVMQLMPDTAAELGVDAGVLEQNIDGGVRMLSHLVAKHGEHAAIAAYNWGTSRVAKYAQWPSGVRSYVADVEARAELEAGGDDPFAEARPDRAHGVFSLQPWPQPLLLSFIGGEP